jgi:hypothetical protein
VDVVLFIALVIKCTAMKSEKIGIVVSAAEGFLGLRDFTAEVLQGIPSMNVVSIQAPGPV